jgi:hypothetical protein
VIGIGTYDASSGTVQSDDVAPPIPVPVPERNGIEDGDRITFEVVAGEARHVGIVRMRPRNQLRSWAR